MKRRIYILVAIIALGGAAAVGWLVWQKSLASQLPDGITSTNGRIEANQVDIATKLPGRVIELLPNEGDSVDAGTIIARIEATDIEHQLHQAEAESQLARQSLAVAQAVSESRKSDLTLAEQEFERTAALSQRGFATDELRDQKQQQLDNATAALKASEAGVAQANAAIVAADAAVDHMQALLADAEIKSPIRGRVQYRLVEPGAVLAAGGRLLSLLDLSDVSMTIFLPAFDAGRLVIGDEARIVLDAAPEYVFPANVTFVSPEAQFTPKTVETAAEREKLMFRVTLQVPKEMLLKLENRVLSGVRGMAYVQTDPAVQWPDTLAIRLPAN